MFPNSLRISVLAFMLAMLVSSVALTQEKDKLTLPRMVPGDGVADPAGEVGYFPNTKGGIDAIGFAKGKVLWSSKDGDRPLLATENRVFVQSGKGNQIRIAVLDAKDGKRILESEAIKFPDWVSVESTYGRTFQGIARTDGKGIYLSWDARAFYAGGARPTPEIEEAARKSASGVARIDLEKGKVEALGAERIKAEKLLPIEGLKVETKVGKLELTIEDRPLKDPNNPFQQRRTLRAMMGKAMEWEVDIKGPIFLPPPP